MAATGDTGLRRGAIRSAARPRGRMRTVVGYVENEAHPDLEPSLRLDCGHVVRQPKGPFGSEDWKRIGDRRECMKCAKEPKP